MPSLRPGTSALVSLGTGAEPEIVLSGDQAPRRPQWALPDLTTVEVRQVAIDCNRLPERLTGGMRVAFTSAARSSVIQPYL